MQFDQWFWLIITREQPMKIIIVVKRPKFADHHDAPLQAALTEALGAKTDSSNSIVVVSIGSSQSTAQLEEAIQTGADKGIHIATPDSLNAYTVAEHLVGIVRREKPELIIISEQLSSEECQTGRVLSSMISESFPIQRSELDRKQYRLLVIREMLSGAHTVLLPITGEANIRKPWHMLPQYQEFLPFQCAL
jgi:electron transfer flavoprotein beta subunit